MGILTDWLTDWLKELLIEGILSHLTGLFDSVNSRVGEIAVQVGTTPAAWNAGVFSLIRQLSETVILPIAGLILTFVATYELIQLIIEKNNLHDLDYWIFFKWIFKTACAILILSNTFNIVMAVFDVSQSVIARAAGIVQGSTDISEAMLADLEATLETLGLGSLLGLWLQSLLIHVTMWAINIVILLVFMFDRIGRIADETPFVVEWFVKNGIRVWSTQEGEQRFDNHTDKLTNYIRFWQADGESEKTSIRTKTALGQLVEDGGFKGGLAPYGYDLVKSGRFNKRKHEVFELAVNEAEAAVVRIIFDKYVHEGFGAQRIATYLNNLGYRARTGKMWHHASVRGIICNLTYTGVLRSGKSRSQTLPHLQIIEQELFEAAQHIRTSRANSAEQERRVPLNTRGQSLLAGNVFCGHCGSRLALTTNGKAYPCKEDAHRIVKRVRYICYGKTRKQTECDGQTGYTAHILDGIIDKVVRQIFERMKAIPKSEIVNIRYREKMEERKALLKSAKSDYAKAAAELDTLRAEVIKSLRGESAFSQDLLGSLISDCETKCLEVQHTMEAAQAAYDEGQAMLDALNAQYDDIISWADMYDSASTESKKMIVSCLIRRVEVYRDYRLHIDFNIDFEQFSAGLDISAIAA